MHSSFPEGGIVAFILYCSTHIRFVFWIFHLVQYFCDYTFSKLRPFHIHCCGYIFGGRNKIWFSIILHTSKTPLWGGLSRENFILSHYNFLENLVLCIHVARFKCVRNYYLENSCTKTRMGLNMGFKRYKTWKQHLVNCMRSRIHIL